MDQYRTTTTRSSILPRRSVSLASTYLMLVAVLLPIARPYLPGNSILLDWVGVVFLPLLWLRIVWERRPVRFPLFWPMLLLVGAGIPPLFNNSYAVLSLPTLLKEVYLYLWFLTMVNAVGEKLPEHLLTAFAITATAIAILAIMQAASPDIRRATSSWGPEVKGGAYAEGSSRSLGLFRNPNMLGNYLALSAVLVLGSPLWKRAGLRWGAAACLVVGVLASASVGSLAALLAGFCAILWLRGLPSPAVLVRLVLGIIIVSIATSVVWDAFLQTQAGALASALYDVERIAISYYDDRVGNIWIPAIEGFLAKPLGTGVGLWYSEERGRFQGLHNDYIGALVERGILGGIGMIWLLISIVRLARPVRRVNFPSVTELYRTALIGMLVVMLVTAWSHSVFRFRQLWFLLFLLVQANESYNPLMNGRSVR